MQGKYCDGRQGVPELKKLKKEVNYRIPYNIYINSAGRMESFLEVLLKRILLEDAAPELTDAAGDCLLPLILCHPAAFERLGDPFIHQER